MNRIVLCFMYFYMQYVIFCALILVLSICVCVLVLGSQYVN